VTSASEVEIDVFNGVFHDGLDKWMGGLLFLRI